MNSQVRLTMPIGEAMFTQRAIRRLRSDPIGIEDIRVFMDAAAKAPNGGNMQPARFVVVNDPQVIGELGKLYHEAWWAKRRQFQGWEKPEDIPPEEKTYLSAMRLADEIKDAPLIVLPCAPKGTPQNSVIPAVQNLLLAARALGIGSCLTTLHPQVDDRVRALLKIPADVEVMCCIPMGYPRGNFGPTNRLPTSQTTYLNAWGDAPPWD